ncbi:hypothetical protein [Microbacterium sp. AR7-10]|uniref:hypothetical protein n=1 Tax=Microbacterium sp. AR7-10 TaxID=1891970 RepID=UPI0008FCD890|nr:hypothetical protein [Microbacterium sp. AR7-10]OIU87704.1 hypothetical protein BFN01_08185 [Microbacterium sp. AR7-10]
MGTSQRLAEHYDLRAEEKQLERYAKTAGPLQSLSERELALDKQPVTTYPQPRRVKAWVRFGPQPARVNALLLRSTDTAVGIEFTIAEKTYRCWVWGNAVELAG